MSVRLSKEQLDEMIKANPDITYTVMAGSEENDIKYGTSNVSGINKTVRQSEAKKSSSSQKEKKTKKYRNTRIYEYADGSISMNERRDNHMTVNELQQYLQEEVIISQKIEETKTTIAILKKTASKKVEKKISRLKERIDDIKAADKDTLKKELSELETVQSSILAAQEKMAKEKQHLSALKLQLKEIQSRNAILKSGKEPEKTVFDSKKEYERWLELQMLQRAGAISNLKRQVPYLLQPSFIYNDEKIREIEYTADFEYLQNGKQIVEDVKGIDRKTKKAITTKDFKLKWKMLKFRYPEIEFRIY